MVIVGLAAATIAWRQETRNSAARETDVADGLAASVRSTAANVVAGLSGAAGLVDEDGDVDPAGFEAFRRDVTAVSTLTRLALIPVVPDDVRADFERDVVRISDFGDDDFGPADERDVYWPVARISPLESLTALLLGVDIGEFPLTASVARAARDSGATVITETVVLEADLVASVEDPAAPVPSTAASGDVVVFFIIKPLYLPALEGDGVAERRGAHVGFVATVYDGESLVGDVRADLPAGVRFMVRDGDNVLARTAVAPDGGVERTIEVGGRTWLVDVEDGRPIGHPLTLLILGITAMVLGGLTYLIRRSDRYERDTARATLLISRTGELSQHLASAATVGDVAAVIERQVPAIFEARSASLGLIDRDGRSVTIQHGPAAPHVPPSSLQRRLDAPGPITEALRAGELVLVKDHADWPTYAAGAGALDDVAAATRSAAGLPLEAADGTVAAAVGILWSRRNQFDETTVATLRTVTELCEQSLHRADLTDQIALRAACLAELAEQLAGAETIEDSLSIVTGLGREPVEAESVTVAVYDETSGALRVHRGDAPADPLGDAESDLVAEVHPALIDAAHTGEPVLLADRDRCRDRYPDVETIAGGAGAWAALPLRDNEEVIGALLMSWPVSRTFDDAFVSTLSTIAEMAAQTVQRSRLTRHQIEDARHSRDLARLAQGLTSRAHTEDVAGFLAAGVVTPLDATHAAVGIVREGVLYRRFSSELPMDDPQVLEQLPATPLTVSTPLTDAARTGEDVLLGSVEDFRVEYPRLASAWESVGFQATANMALRDRTGRLIGALGVAWDHPVQFTKELRDRLTTIVGIAGQTLERSQLADLLRDTATRNEQLADFAQHVARVRTVAELCDAVIEHGAAPVEATVANLALVDEATQRLRVVAHPSLGDAGVELSDGAALYANLPGPESIRSQLPVLLMSPSDISRRFPGPLADAMSDSGLEASAHLPITSPLGTPLGSIAFAWRSPQHFPASSLATMRTISELCAQTIERARLGEAEHRLVSSLQNRVVTPLPASSGLTIAQRYQPAARHVGMGGDWYDGIVLDDGRYVLVIGDVAGHGITAVADMIQLRAIIDALVRGRVGLGDVFPRASALLQRNDDGVTASACVTVFDPRAATLTYLAAGHPPPMLRSVDGTAAVLELGRQALLGVPMATGAPATVEFPPGAMFVAYTDGLIERREESIDVSIERLRTATSEIDGSDVEAVADELIDRCLEGRDPADDVALVVVRSDAVP